MMSFVFREGTDEHRSVAQLFAPGIQRWGLHLRVCESSWVYDEMIRVCMRLGLIGEDTLLAC